MRQFLDWITGRTALRKMQANHDYKMRLLDQAAAGLLTAVVEVAEFRRAWRKEIEGKP